MYQVIRAAYVCVAAAAVVVALINLLLSLLVPPSTEKERKKTMARAGAGTSPSYAHLALLLLALYFTSGEILQSVNGEKTWCVAKPSSDGATLLANINYACSQVDCGVLQRGCPCFFPDTPISHASVAMNLYYQSRGRNPWNCFFKNSGLVVTTDPSFGPCSYA